MAAFLRFIFRSPLRAAIVCGMLVTVLFGLASFPRPELSKAVSDWRVEDVILPDADQQRLLSARDAALAGEGDIVQLTEAEFRGRGLTYTLSLPLIEDSARRFVIEYVGMEDLAGGTVYTAERQIFAAPWWSPHRFIYKAASAEVDAFREVLVLTFERDILGLSGLVLVDAIVGAIYGLVIGMIVSVLRGVGLAPTPRHGDKIRHQALSRP